MSDEARSVLLFTARPADEKVAPLLPCVVCREALAKRPALVAEAKGPDGKIRLVGIHAPCAKRSGWLPRTAVARAVLRLSEMVEQAENAGTKGFAAAAKIKAGLEEIAALLRALDGGRR